MFVDTNVFIRFLTGDHPEHSPMAKAFIRDLETGKHSGWTTTQAFMEMAYVMHGTIYRMSRDDVAERLVALMDIGALRINEKQVLRRAFRIWRDTEADLPDAYHAALVRSRGESRIWSFDRDFDGIEGIERLEPGP